VALNHKAAPVPLVPLCNTKWDQAPLSETPTTELRIAPDSVNTEPGPTGPTPKQDFQENTCEDPMDDELWEVGEV
jgi:hypothetical protein